jgi:hypothetical protein
VLSLLTELFLHRAMTSKQQQFVHHRSAQYTPYSQDLKETETHVVAGKQSVSYKSAYV